MKISRNLKWGGGLLLPSLIFLSLFTFFPTVATIWDSLHSTPHGRRAAVWIGTSNYTSMMADPVFIKAFVNNMLYAVITIPLSVGLALGMALLVNAHIRWKGFARLAFFTPTILPMVAVANIWTFIYAPDYGLLDRFLDWFNSGGNNWLGSPDTALPALMAIAVWKNAGFYMIFYLAGLQAIPPVLLEASKLEGANSWQTLRRVILPLLGPTTLFVAINAIINAFSLVDHVVALTKGGPDNATQLLLNYIYQMAFNFWDRSYAATLSVVLLAVLAIIALLQFALADKRTFYQ